MITLLCAKHLRKREREREREREIRRDKTNSKEWKKSKNPNRMDSN